MKKIKRFFLLFCLTLFLMPATIIRATQIEDIEIQDGQVNEAGTAVVKKGNGYLTVVAHVNADITDTVYIQFFNKDTYQEYAYYLYAINDYKTNIELKAGNYMISGGGVIEDTKGLYPIEEKEFVIQPANATYLEVGIGVEPNQMGVYNEAQTIEVITEDEEGIKYIENNNQSETIRQIESVNKEEYEKQESEKIKANMKKQILSFGFSLISVSIITGIFIFIYMKKRE